MLDRTCVECGATLTGKQTRFCSNRCAMKAARQERSTSTAISYHECTICRATFVQRAGNGRQVCSNTCRNKRNRLQRSEASRAKQLLSKRNGKRYPTSVAARRRFDAKRKAVKRGARTRGAAFSIDDVISRDGWTCGICSMPIDSALSWPHPEYRSLDHVIPVSVGGTHSLDNVQLAHFSCNSRKGNRAA